MITIQEDFVECHDEKAKLKGLLIVRCIELYEKGDYPVPEDTLAPANNPPCLVFSVLDYELSTAEIKLMKPVLNIPLTRTQENIIKKWREEI